MPKIEKTLILNVPAETVFSYVINPTNMVEWLPGMTQVTNVVGLGKGQHFNWTYKMVGMTMHGQSEVTEYMANRHIVVKSTGGITSTWTWDFSGDANKTSVNLVVDYAVPVPVVGRIAERLVLHQNEREAELAMTNIKGRLEG